ncbi:hypothetical protein [Demequina soli]|uniref:hypothetical protein n=1 Tax=Demequina soli TaxID=1638987 RepID=UPI0007850A4F|nr:hypothetical protein [Demequina soli]
MLELLRAVLAVIAVFVGAIVLATLGSLLLHGMPVVVVALGVAVATPGAVLALHRLMAGSGPRRLA